jgi:hypothetical protein
MDQAFLDYLYANPSMPLPSPIQWEEHLAAVRASVPRVPFSPDLLQGFRARDDYWWAEMLANPDWVWPEGGLAPVNGPLWQRINRLGCMDADLYLAERGWALEELLSARDQDAPPEPQVWAEWDLQFAYRPPVEE